IAVAFSIAELRRLAESMGIAALPWDRGIHEAARELVKQSERYAGLEALVAKLREEKPLFEWPEPLAGAMGEDSARPPRAPSAPPTSAPAARPPPITGAAGPPALGSTPGSFGPPAQAAPIASAPPPASEPAPALRDPYAPPPGPAAIQ